MKKYLALTVLFLLLAVGCRRGMSTAVYEDELIMPAGEGSPDSLLLSISLEYVRGGVPAPVKEKINQAILSRAFDLEEQDAGLEETAIRYRENLIDEFLTENTGAEGYTSTWEDRTSGTFGESWKKWKNYLFTYYQFRGGAHGLQTVSPLVFDLTTGEVVEETDLFAPGYIEPVSKLMQEAVTRSMGADYEELLPLVNLPSIIPNDNFAVRQEGVEWFFQPYDVGPYALGIVSATVSWEALQPYLK